MASPQSSTPPAPVVSLFTNTCEICGFPIRPGPEWVDESRAKVHRQCLRAQTHDLAVDSECQDLWLKAYTLLCERMPEPRTNVIPLAMEYQHRLNVDGYLEHLARAMELIPGLTMTDDEKTGLIRQITLLRDRIVQLAQTKTPQQH